MKSNMEGWSQHGAGVTYKPTVSVRNDRVKGHGDMKQSGTKEAFNKSNKNTKETW